MNKIACFLLVLTIGWWSCNSAPKDPVAVVKAFMRAVEKRDYVKAIEFTTDRLRDLIEAGMKDNDDSGLDGARNFELTLLEKDDEYARVAVRDVTKDEPMMHALLKKENGKWLIYNVNTDTKGMTQ